jgi:molybdopterin molybdotransferase
MPGHEFFTALTVAEALRGFRPARRTPAEVVALGDALHRVPSAPLAAPSALPGFARATVDGFAVRAADTYGASDGLPGYLDVVGSVRMGTTPTMAVRPGTAVAIPTGGALPPGADAVVMVEYTQEAMPGTIEVVRPAAPGDGLVRADEDVAAGAQLVPAGRPLRAQDLGLLAAAGVEELSVWARPIVAIISTGDEVVPASTPVLLPGQVRDATAVALAGLVTGAGGTPWLRGIVPDDARALDAALRAATAACDVAVVSAGSSVGARDETAGVVAGLGPPGVFCHGLAIRPGKPTLLAECDGVPVIGLPGNPLSALVVFRLVGLPLLRRVGGCLTPPPEPTTRARLARQVPSAAGRLDVVQVRLCDGSAEPIFGHSALLSVLAAADGYLIVPEAATGVAAGAEVDVVLYQ